MRDLLKSVVVGLMAAWTIARPVHALQAYLTSFETTYPSAAASRIDTCNLCHTTVPQLNPYGTAFANAGHMFASIEGLDSDGDGYTNLAEIEAHSFPGDPSDTPVPVPTPTNTAPPPPTATVTNTGTSIRSSTPTHTAASGSPTATGGPATCVGDCNGNRVVSIDELVTAVNIALGSANVAVCPAADPSHSGMVTVDELVVAVAQALRGCPLVPTSSPTASPPESTSTPTTAPPEPTSTPTTTPPEPTSTPTTNPAVGTGTLQGRVTNSLTGGPLAGASVTLNPAIAGVTISTAADGTYSADLPIGVYAVTFAKQNYTSQNTAVSVLDAQLATVNVPLVPVAPVVLTTSLQGTAQPGATITASVSITPLDGSTVQTIAWSQSDGVQVAIDAPNAATTMIGLPDVSAYKEQLFKQLGQEPLDRFIVQALNPFQLDHAGLVTVTATVTTTSGTYTADAQINAQLPWEPNPGLQNVSVGNPILLHGKILGDGAVYDWNLTTPAGSATTLTDATTQNPYFTPDLPGHYTLTVTDTTKNPSQVVHIEIDAGNWVGALTGVGADGRPDASGCTGCHKQGGIAPDNFTPWRLSGHAEIFTQNFTTPMGHYATSCLTCHTVGWDLGANNGGIDDQANYANFLNEFTSDGTTFVGHTDNFTKLLSMFPDVAKFTNVQCENCHGPNSTPLHYNGTLDAARISIASEVCGVCHGEPARHGRFQQWQQSGHGQYDLAMQEATVEGRGATANHCGRCHAGQGFLAWIQQDDLTKVIQGANGNATVAELSALGLTVDSVYPQTCTTCHDPHAEGSTTGKPNNATVRITDNTPLLPAGFAALGVGRGAICITCHNTRNGLHNDDVGLPTNYTAPHTPAQGDVLMGQNAYFVAIGSRSPHSFIADTCTTCHMELTPPPAEFSYEGSGTNHTFKASLTICTQCHGVFDGGTLQESAQAELNRLSDVMVKYLQAKITNAGMVFVKDYTPHTFGGKSYDLKSGSVQVSASNITVSAPTEPHGQQGFTISFTTPVEFTYSPQGESPHMLSLSQAQVQLGDFTTDGTAALIPPDNPLVRGGWNFFLIQGDGSKGVHNPSFVFSAVDAARAALESALEVEVPD
jgi:hypothetical protein